ncbi:MAG: LysM peptidoglycan-binding domain-containing protein [Bacteroidetes bacterium]|nr:MAG: LysM peptidoglycan-binding domain-containing protein [Bacteroidota bacterium]
MPLAGKLEKMLILGFKDSEEAENGGVAEAKANGAYYEALINPESYSLAYKLKFSDEGQGQGTSGTQLKYEYTEPEEITFEFLFDNTGIIDGRPREHVADDIEEFKKVVVGYQGDSHEPLHFKLVWGQNSIFKGRVTEVDITYKLFKPDGTPIRAVAKVTFKSSIEEEKRAATEDRNSPDLSHVRTVKLGDTLPLMCYRIYGDPRYYLQVAAVNELNNFRDLEPGTQLVFPPIEKQ